MILFIPHRLFCNEDVQPLMMKRKGRKSGGVNFKCKEERKIKE